VLRIFTFATYRIVILLLTGKHYHFDRLQSWHWGYV